MGKKKTFSVTFVAVVLLILLTIAPSMASAKPESDKYTARTADGVDLAMKRYRPDQKAGFRKAGQPIILTAGIMANINCFDIYTPEGKTFNVELPSPLASWATHDKYIEKDPMRYYSLAHYLWNQGYDVWLANYRGMGREPYVSGGATGYSIDDCGIYDVPALVEKVYQVTRKHPIWLGHSMGSSMAYMYLEGARYGEGDNPHVVSDPALVAERNGGKGKQALKALVVLDGPMGTEGGFMPGNDLLWNLFYTPWYFDVRSAMLFSGDWLGGPAYIGEQLSWFFYQMFGSPDLGMLNMIFMANPSNIDPNVMTYEMGYAVDGGSTRTFGQFEDWYASQKCREDYLNGPENAANAMPPDPAPGDGYYYYSDNLSKVTLPAMVLADSTVDITSPNDIKYFYLNKGKNRRDVFIKVPNTAHVDLYCGLNGPTYTFQEIGKWLRKLPR